MMMTMTKSLSCLVFALVSETSAFTVLPPGNVVMPSSPLTRLAVEVLDPNQPNAAAKRMPFSLAERFFQLEEMEDRDTSTTEIHLNWDNTVRVGETDGPCITNGSGRWTYNPDTHAVELSLTRHYAAGHHPCAPTDMGEFDYQLDRTYVGHVEWTGDKVSISGSIHYCDAARGDEQVKVGYFSMLDTSPERMGQLQQQQQQQTTQQP